MEWPRDLPDGIGEEASGQPLSKVFHIINEKTREVAENPVDKALKYGRIVSLANHTALIAKDGAERIIADSAAPILHKDGSIIGVVLVFRDITEFSRLEKEKETLHVNMVAASKLASLGEVATGVAHEINQSLTYISGFIQNLYIDLKDDAIDKDELTEKLTMSNKQVSRIVNIIQHLRTFARQDDVVKRQIKIEAGLNDTLLLMGERIRLRNVEFVKDVESGLPPFFGNATRLEEVFINLFQNAMDAFSDKHANAGIRVNISVSEDKEFIVIKVEDNGNGIRQEIADKIFEPFFTTKSVGEGTGLGLSIVYGIIREHDGTITCESEPGKGTAFTIKLPITGC